MAENRTLLDIATGTPGVSVLTGIVVYLDEKLGSELVDALGAPGNGLTVFAPTNEAFGALAVDLHFTGDPNDPAAVLEFFTNEFKVDPSLLLTTVQYHISAGTKLADDIGDLSKSSEPFITTLAGGATISLDALPKLGDLDPDAEDPSLGLTDIHATNGVVHLIDQVLRPTDLPAPTELPTITGTVLALSGLPGEGFDENPADFDFLRESVLKADLAGVLDEEFADLTVLAPTDAAFMNLSKALGYTGSDEEGGFEYLYDSLRLLNKGEPAEELLGTVLKYHVSAGNQNFAEVADAGFVTTLLDNTVTLEGETLADVDPDNENAGFVEPFIDVKASNGIIHVIDGVLLPADLLQSDGSNDVDFIIGDNGRDRYKTGADNDYIDAKDGRDKVIAGSGDDVVLAGGGRDYVNGGSGNDHLMGEGGKDKILGGIGDDMIDGGAGRDWISGGFGDDIINGGTGNDRLFGGFGEDTFVFDLDSGNDRISLFQSGQDKIDLSAYGIMSFDDIDIDRKGFFRSEIDLYDGSSISVSHSFFGLSEDDFILAEPEVI